MMQLLQQMRSCMLPLPLRSLVSHTIHSVEQAPSRRHVTIRHHVYSLQLATRVITKLHHEHSDQVNENLLLMRSQMTSHQNIGKRPSASSALLDILHRMWSSLQVMANSSSVLHTRSWTCTG